MTRFDAGSPIVVGQMVEAPLEKQRFSPEWTVTVTCPYCGASHTHAAPQGPRIDPGFRLAHCRLDRQGYTIVLAGSDSAAGE